MKMLPVCSTTPSCSIQSQISFHGVLCPFSSFQKEFGSKCFLEYRVLSLPKGLHFERDHFRAHFTKCLYSDYVKSTEKTVFEHVQCKYSDIGRSAGNIYKQHLSGRLELKYVEDSYPSATDLVLKDLSVQLNENSNILSGSVETEPLSAPDMVPEASTSLSASLEMDVSTVNSSFEEILDGVRKSFSVSVDKGENAVKSSLETINSSISSVIESANEVVDKAVSGVFSTVDQTGEVAGDRLTNLSGNFKEGTTKAAVVAIDVLRHTIIIVEDSLTNGASFVLYSYQSAKDLLPPYIKDALNLSEEKAAEILRPAKIALHQVYIAIEGLEASLGLDPQDPIVPFVLFLGTSATLWVFYWVWAYSGYSGDLSPKSTLEILTRKDNTVLIDVRPEDLRERDGIPDLRRSARLCYASVTLPEIDGYVRKLLKGGQELDDTLAAAVIRNLKIVQDRSCVIVMDANGSRSKGIARLLRKLGTKKTYLVQGGYQSWVKHGLRVKELKPETALTILNEEAEAILEDINPSPVQVLGYGVGLIAGLYALLEWEKTFQLIGIIGLGQTIYRRVVSYEDADDFKQDLRLLLAPVKVGAQAFTWAAGKLETNGIGLPTSPSSSDVQNRVLQAVAKHESQPSDDSIPDSLSDSATPVNENVDLSEA